MNIKIYFGESYRFPEDGEKKTFKSILKSTMFTSKLFYKQVTKRPKCVIIYGTETGASQRFAKKLNSIFNQGFNSEVFSISDFEIKHIKQMSRDPNSLLLVVTSTFGNGDPPQHAEKFNEELQKQLTVASKSISTLDKDIFKGLK